MVDSPTEPIAYICEVYHDGWHDFVSRTHPDEVFDHVDYRDVRPLVEADS